MKNKILIAVLIISLLFLSACNTRSGGIDYKRDSKTERYYQGSEGVRMLIDPGAPPPRVYYYKDAPTDSYNSFNIDTELQNVGASWTKGGLYISGYDPSMIFVEQHNIPRTTGGWFENCRVSISNLGWDSLAGLVGCNINEGGVTVAGDASRGDLSVNINNLFQIFGLEGLPEFDLGYDQSTGGFTFDFSAFGLDLEVLNHGRAMLMVLDSITFDRYNGEAFMLAPDDPDFPGGESTLISFPAYVQNWPQGLDETDVTFLVTACYAYSTYATPVVCIDPDPFSENEKVCYPGEIDLKNSQGAPVAVTRVLQENTPRSVIYTIEIQNVGRGTVINPGDLELCSPYFPGRVGVQSLDTVILGDVRMSGSPQRLRCVPDSRIVRLRDGRGQITCTYDLEYVTAKSAYKAPLIVEFWYGYSESIRRNVHIKRVS